MNDAERISQLENLVAKLTEVVRLQGRRIDRLEAELEMRGCTVDVIVARKAEREPSRWVRVNWLPRTWPTELT